MSRITTPGFDAWYKIYPRKQARGDAFKAWKQVEAEDITEEIIAATKKYPFSTDPKYIKLPASFLRAWCWEDSFTDDSDHSALRDALR
jgi:hypothetical protein